MNDANDNGALSEAVGSEALSGAAVEPVAAAASVEAIAAAVTAATTVVQAAAPPTMATAAEHEAHTVRQHLLDEITALAEALKAKFEALIAKL